MRKLFLALALLSAAAGCASGQLQAPKNPAAPQSQLQKPAAPEPKPPVKRMYLRPVGALMIRQQAPMGGEPREITVAITYDDGSKVAEDSIAELATKPFAFQEEDSPFTRKVEIAHLRKITRLPEAAAQPRRWRVELDSGETFEAEWVEEEGKRYDYERSLPGVHGIRKLSASPRGDESFDLKRVRVLEFSRQPPGKASPTPSPAGDGRAGPAVAVLFTNGKTEQAGDALLLDYCGHWGRTNVHTYYLKSGYVPFEDGRGASSIASVADLREMEFTGSRKGEWGLPQIVLRYKNGEAKTGYLRLSTESYGGEETAGFDDRLDSVALKTPYGWLETLLVNVRKITFSGNPNPPATPTSPLRGDPPPTGVFRDTRRRR